MKNISLSMLLIILAAESYSYYEVVEAKCGRRDFNPERAHLYLKIKDESTEVFSFFIQNYIHYKGGLVTIYYSKDRYLVGSVSNDDTSSDLPGLKNSGYTELHNHPFNQAIPTTLKDKLFSLMKEIELSSIPTITEKGEFPDINALKTFPDLVGETI